MFSTVSCEKKKLHAEPEPTRKACIWCYAAIYAGIEIIKALAEGQYYEQYENGELTAKGCSGVGSCAISGKVSGGDHDGELLSQNPVEPWDYFDEYHQKVHLLKMNSGQVVLTYAEDANQSDMDSFFYDDTIHVSREWVIDNPNVLDILDESEPIVFEEGDHIVQYDEDNHPYLILSE